MAVKKLSHKKPAPEPDLVVIEPEPTFTIRADQPTIRPLTPEQGEAQVMVSAAQATVNELGRETVDKASALVLAIRVVQSAKRLMDLLRA